MGFKLLANPTLDKPIMIASWPGIGNIGLIAVDSLRKALDAEELGEVDAWEFFHPRGISIREGKLEDVTFPRSRFFYKRTEKRDLILFVGEEQPSDTGAGYASGHSAYRLANLVLDVAQRFNCPRVFTSGAAVARTHHTMVPRVWAVPNSAALLSEVRTYENTVVMSQVEGRRGQGKIAGLNGLLLGVARKRGVEAVCIMGEIPIYLQGLPLTYPKASLAVVEVLRAALGLAVEMRELRLLVDRGEREVESLYQRFPAEIRAQLDRLKQVAHPRQNQTGPITEEDKKQILEEIDRFFKREKNGE